MTQLVKPSPAADMLFRIALTFGEDPQGKAMRKTAEAQQEGSAKSSKPTCQRECLFEVAC